MQMESHQVCTVIDKLYKEIKEDIHNIFHKGGDPKCILELDEHRSKVHTVRFGYADTEQEKAVMIKRDGNTITVKIQTNINNISGDYKIKYHPFSRVWWKWKKLSGMINRNMNKIRAKELQIKKNHYGTAFNDLYATMFPEEIDKILLGGKNDK